ncbi:hypothetical protein ACWEQG_29500 [Microbispora sp. NPDC004025]
MTDGATALAAPAIGHRRTRERSAGPRSDGYRQRLSAAGPRVSEQAVDLARLAGVRPSNGSVAVVRKATARGGARVVFTPAAVGDHLEYPVTVPRRAEYDLLLRYYRSPAAAWST